MSRRVPRGLARREFSLFRSELWGFFDSLHSLRMTSLGFSQEAETTTNQSGLVSVCEGLSSVAPLAFDDLNFGSVILQGHPMRESSPRHDRSYGRLELI